MYIAVIISLAVSLALLGAHSTVVTGMPPHDRNTSTQGSVFMLHGITYPNNSIVLIENIGEGDNALICTTTYDGCCTSPPHGYFYYSNNTFVTDSRTGSTSLYVTRDSGMIRLNQKSGLNAPLGTYRCQMPNSRGELRSIYITIATLFECLRYPTSESVSTTQAPLTTVPTTASSSTTEKLSTTQAPLTTAPTTATTPTSTSISTSTTALPPSTVYLEINGNRLESGSSIFIEDIGANDDALLCHTDFAGCCKGKPKYGEFYYPDNTLVQPRGAGGAVYRNRGDGFIRLNANPTSSEPFSPGIYRCEIPDTNGNLQSLYVNILIRTSTTQTSTTQVPVTTQASTTQAPTTQTSTTHTPSTTTPIDCGDLSDPENGDVSYPSTTVGSLARYKCNNGYKLVGNTVRGCFSNGRWSGSAPTCKIIECVDLSEPENGDVSYPSTSVGSVATYSCDVGYGIVNGSRSRTCLSTGRWSGSAPACSRSINITCKSLDNPGNGFVDIDRKGNPFIVPGSVATYICFGGFAISGEATRECGNDGKWSGSTPTCEVSNPQVAFQLNDEQYLSGSVISLASIGEGDNALRCFTNNQACCRNQSAGAFYYPDGNEVLHGGSGLDIYINRDAQYIRLNRRNGATQPTGSYTCRIPDADNVVRELVIYLI